MFSITQKFEITEDQLKRYNKELYAEPLKKGMVLKIPIYKKETEIEEDDEKALDFDAYTVTPKETRWSIAHKYGISVDSLLALNPQLSKTNSLLPVGIELVVPRPKGDSLQEQEVVLFETYTVPKSIGLYRVSQEFSIPMDSIIKLNPQITEQGGLKEGMQLQLPKKKPLVETINTDNFIFYQVKPKQGIFRLTKELKTSRDSLLLFNPELENGVKAGMVLKLPITKETELNVKNSLVLDAFELKDSLNVAYQPNVLFMLPFRLDKTDFSNETRTESQVQRNDVGAALGFYSGAVMAIDSLKKLGVSVNAEFFDTKRNLNNVRTYFEQNTLVDVQAIIGPIDRTLLNEIAVRTVSNQTPVITPYASSNNLSFSNLFYAKPKDQVLSKRLLSYVEKHRKDEELIVIADAKHQAVRDSILARFPTARIAKMSEDGSLHRDDFEAMLFENKTHWVFVESNDSDLLASVSSILNADNAKELYSIRMFTASYNSSFESEDLSPVHLSNLGFTFTSGVKEGKKDSFVKKYTDKVWLSAR